MMQQSQQIQTELAPIAPLSLSLSLSLARARSPGRFLEE
jgi:hypothetical protein